MSRVFVFLDRGNAGDRLKPRAKRRNTAPRPAPPRQIARYILVSMLLPLLLSACAIEGDFGRPQPTIFDRVADEFLSSEATLLGSRGGSGVTDDEMAMREAGFRLSSPFGPPAQGVAGPYGGTGPIGLPLVAIEGELKRDHQILTQFGIASRRVLVTDARRMQAVYENDPNLLVEDKRSARERMRENISFIESTFEDFGRRQKAFFYAIDEIRTTAPDAYTLELEGSLNHLRDRSASLEYELNYYFGAAVARGEYRPPRFASRERSRYGTPVPYRRSDQPAQYSSK